MARAFSKRSLFILIVGLVALLALACKTAEPPAPAPTTAPPVVAPTSPPAAAAPTAMPAVAPTARPAVAPTAMPAPAPTTAPPPVAMAAPKGTLVAVTQTVDVGSGYPVDCLWCASITVAGAHETLFGAVRQADGNLTVGPMLAESWTTSPDLKYTDMKIRQGVKFHKGFGEMTADDVAYTFNALNPKVTKEARHDSGGEVGQSLDKVDVIDKNTVRFNWAALGGTTLIQLFADAGEGIGTFPKKAFDEKGADWMRTNIVGTGPFVMDEWTQQKGMFLTAFPDHWRKTPYVEKYRILEVPEPATRLAMMETAEAQIGGLIPLKNRKALLAKDIKMAPEGFPDSHGFPFGGNYWENKDPKTGAPIERVRDISRVWVGDPYEGGKTEFDPNTPSMQRALKVRQALNMSIDRDTINEVILGGLGTVGYIGGVGITDPIWKANKDRWSVKYDPDKAKQLLKEAGYENGGFTLYWWAGLDSAHIEESEAIAADWLTRFNIKSEHDRRTYTTIRPNLVLRTFPVLRMHGCCTDPGPWPREWIWSALGVNSYNHGLELPKATEVQNRKVAAKDVAEMVKATTEMVDYISQWQLLSVIAEVDGVALYNGKLIESWQMTPLINLRLGGIRNPEFVKLK